MDANKVRELIADLERDIRSKVNAINALRALLGSNVEGELTGPVPQIVQSRDVALADLSYIDLTVKAIEANDNRPVEMKRLVDFIRTAKGNPNIERRSIEATIAQHMKAKGERSRVVKTSPGVYGLGVRRFPRTEPAA